MRAGILSNNVSQRVKGGGGNEGGGTIEKNVVAMGRFVSNETSEGNRSYSGDGRRHKPFKLIVATIGLYGQLES